jgi:CBS domain-containing protein
MAVIRDILSKSVVSIRPETTMLGAVKTLTKHHLSGAPVVASDGEVVGFISEGDLMDVLFDETVRSAPVSEYMNRDIHVVQLDDTISSVATMFALYGIRRLPVVENGRLIGVVTRRDLLKYSLTSAEPLNEPLLELIPALGEYA